MTDLRSFTVSAWLVTIVMFKSRGAFGSVVLLISTVENRSRLTKRKSQMTMRIERFTRCADYVVDTLRG